MVACRALLRDPHWSHLIDPPGKQTSFPSASPACSQPIGMNYYNRCINCVIITLVLLARNTSTPTNDVIQLQFYGSWPHSLDLGRTHGNTWKWRQVVPVTSSTFFQKSTLPSAAQIPRLAWQEKISSFQRYIYVFIVFYSLQHSTLSFHLCDLQTWYFITLLIAGTPDMRLVHLKPWQKRGGDDWLVICFQGHMSDRVLVLTDPLSK